MFASPRGLPHRISFILIGSVMLAAAAGAADDLPFWPQFHGPNRDNISTEEGLLDAWPEGGPTRVWTAEGLGYGYSSMAIAGGMMYTAGNIDGNTVVTALDMEGNILWQVKNGAAWTQDRPGTRGTPTVDGDRVYHESPIGNVICLDAKTGDINWELNILDKFDSENIHWGLSESLLIDGDNVICSPGGPQASMVALNKHTGAVVWKAPSTGELAGYASPVLAEIEGLRMVITMTAKGLIGVNADTGELLWHVDHESYTDQNTTGPVLEGNEVFVSTLQGGSVKWRIGVEDGKAKIEEVWRTNDFDNHHGGVVLVNGNLYGTSMTRNRNKWVCLDWESSEVKHVDEGVGKGSMTYADGMLYALGENGDMGLVRPTAGGHEMISSFEIPEGGKGNSWAHPVVCAGRLYIRHGEFLYAYDVSE